MSVMSPYKAPMTNDEFIESTLKLVTEKDAARKLFVELGAASNIESREILSLAFILLAQIRLKINVPTFTTDRLFPLALSRSRAVATISESLVPDEIKPQIAGAFLGFEEFFHNASIRTAPRQERERINQLFGVNDKERESETTNLLYAALELLLTEKPPSWANLPVLKKPERSSKEVEELIYAFGEPICEIFGGDVPLIHMSVIYEGLAFMRRFYRKRWRVEVEDVLDAWAFCDYFLKKELPKLAPAAIEILRCILARNDVSKKPSQNEIFQETGLSWGTINSYLSAKEGKEGDLVRKGLVAVTKAEKYNRYSYTITQYGRYALADGKIALEVNGKVYQLPEVLC